MKNKSWPFLLPQKAQVLYYIASIMCVLLMTLSMSKLANSSSVDEIGIIGDHESDLVTLPRLWTFEKPQSHLFQTLTEFEQSYEYTTLSIDGQIHSPGLGSRPYEGIGIPSSFILKTYDESQPYEILSSLKITPEHLFISDVPVCEPYFPLIHIENTGNTPLIIEAIIFEDLQFNLLNSDLFNGDINGLVILPGRKQEIHLVFIGIRPMIIKSLMYLHIQKLGVFRYSLHGTTRPNELNLQGVDVVTGIGDTFKYTISAVNSLMDTIRVTEVYTLNSHIHFELPNQEKKDLNYSTHSHHKRNQLGIWDLVAGKEKSIATLIYQPSVNEKIGKLKNMLPIMDALLAYVRVLTSDNKQYSIPIRIRVLEPGLHLYPKQLDMGIFTSINTTRDVYLTIFNTGNEDYQINELAVLNSNVDIVAGIMETKKLTIPRHTSMQNAIKLRIKPSQETVIERGEKNMRAIIFAETVTDMLSTKMGKRQLQQQTITISGKVVLGYISYSERVTSIGVIAPLGPVFSPIDSSKTVHNVNEEEYEIIEETDRVAGYLYSVGSFHGYESTPIGKPLIVSLSIKNAFGYPLSLLNAAVLPVTQHHTKDKYHNALEVELVRYKRFAIAAPGKEWPTIELQVIPLELPESPHIMATRGYSLVVQTNISQHVIPINLFHGILSYEFTGNLVMDSHTSGFTHAEEITYENEDLSCLSLNENVKDFIDERAAQFGYRLCRSIILDMGNISFFAKKVEFLNISNINPVTIPLKTTFLRSNVSKVDPFHLSIEKNILSQSDQLPVFIQRSANLYESSSYLPGSDPTTSQKDLLLPGRTLQVGLSFTMNRKLGYYDRVPILTVESPYEVVHVFVRLNALTGRIVPSKSRIVLPSAAFGRVHYVEMYYRNTFPMAVQVTDVEVTDGHPPLHISEASSPQFSFVQLLNVLDFVPSAHEMKKATDRSAVSPTVSLLFAPHNRDCLQEEFFVNCFFHSSNMPSALTLSAFGEIVTAVDELARNQRHEIWTQTIYNSTSSVARAFITLKSPLFVADTVEIISPLEIPQVTVPQKENEDTVYEFSLTEVYTTGKLFVDVKNPSDLPVVMELALGENSQLQFFDCQNEIRNVKNGPFSDRSRRKMTTQQCLNEWIRVITRMERHDNGRIDGNQIPFFYMKASKIVVPAREKASLGPIYFHPLAVSNATEITKVYIRNQLTHIEPITIYARSAKGSLSINVATNKNDTVLTSNNYTERGGICECTHTLTFHVPDISTWNERATNGIQNRHVVELVNLGKFNVYIKSLELTGSNAFEVAMKKSEASMVRLPLEIRPNQRIPLFIQYLPLHCFSSYEVAVLRIDGSDGKREIQLIRKIPSRKSSRTCQGQAHAMAIGTLFRYKFLFDFTYQLLLWMWMFVLIFAVGIFSKCTVAIWGDLVYFTSTLSGRNNHKYRSVSEIAKLNLAITQRLPSLSSTNEINTKVMNDLNNMESEHLDFQHYDLNDYTNTKKQVYLLAPTVARLLESRNATTICTPSNEDEQVSQNETSFIEISDDQSCNDEMLKNQSYAKNSISIKSSKIAELNNSHPDISDISVSMTTENKQNDLLEGNGPLNTSTSNLASDFSKNEMQKQPKNYMKLYNVDANRQPLDASSPEVGQSNVNTNFGNLHAENESQVYKKPKKFITNYLAGVNSDVRPLDASPSTKHITEKENRQQSGLDVRKESSERKINRGSSGINSPLITHLDHSATIGVLENNVDRWKFKSVSSTAEEAAGSKMMDLPDPLRLTNERGSHSKTSPKLLDDRFNKRRYELAPLAQSFEHQTIGSLLQEDSYQQRHSPKKISFGNQFSSDWGHGGISNSLSFLTPNHRESLLSDHLPDQTQSVDWMTATSPNFGSSTIDTKYGAQVKPKPSPPPGFTNGDLTAAIERTPSLSTRFASMADLHNTKIQSLDDSTPIHLQSEGENDSPATENEHYFSLFGSSGIASSSPLTANSFTFSNIPSTETDKSLTDTNNVGHIGSNRQRRLSLNTGLTFESTFNLTPTPRQSYIPVLNPKSNGTPRNQSSEE